MGDGGGRQMGMVASGLALRQRDSSPSDVDRRADAPSTWNGPDSRKQVIGTNAEHPTERGNRVGAGVRVGRGLESPNVRFARESSQTAQLPSAHAAKLSSAPEACCEHDQHIAPSNTLVKEFCDQHDSRRGMLLFMRESPDMPALRKRLQDVLDAKRVRNASAWSLAAQLARSHVNTILSEKTKRVETDTIFRLADAAGVSRSWLAFGDGSMVEEAPTPEAVGAFEGAVSWFLATETHEGRADEARAFLAQRRQLNAGAERLSPDAWLAKLRDEFRAYRAPSKVVGVREVDPDDNEDLRPPKINARRR